MNPSAIMKARYPHLPDLEAKQGSWDIQAALQRRIPALPAPLGCRAQHCPIAAVPGLRSCPRHHRERIAAARIQGGRP